MPVCNHCGAPLENDALFCTACGAARGEASAGPAEATGRRLSIPFLLLGFGLALLLLTGAYFLLPKEGGAAPEPRLEGPGYSSPREAAEAFLQALSEGDLDAMLSSFAQESYVQQLDKGEYLNGSAPAGDQHGRPPGRACQEHLVLLPGRAVPFPLCAANGESRLSLLQGQR